MNKAIFSPILFLVLIIIGWISGVYFCSSSGACIAVPCGEGWWAGSCLSENTKNTLNMTYTFLIGVLLTAFVFIAFKKDKNAAKQ